MSMVRDICERAARTKYDVQLLSTEKKNAILTRAAADLVEDQDRILAANDCDVRAAKEKGMKASMVDRLRLTPDRIAQMAEGLKQVASLPDPVGRVLDAFDRPSGIHIEKVSVPLGVIGIIYESRPNVTADAFALTLKSGNVVVLKGGSDAIFSNEAITKSLQRTLREEGAPEDAVLLIDSVNREDTKELMQMKGLVDVLIPRGSKRLIQAVTENSRVPVIETGSGNCCIYVDRAADLEKSIPVILNAKTQRTGVCNAAESLIVHRDIEKDFLPLFARAMKEHSVELHADEESLPFLPDAVPATEEDYETEYLDLKMSVKTVGSVEEAIDHINRVHTGHSDCILTTDPAAAEKFLERVDSACVYVNASTRFTDGFEFGFGAEIGISTQKLHARGPMGLTELTSYKYRVTGDYAVRG